MYKKAVWIFTGALCVGLLMLHFCASAARNTESNIEKPTQPTATVKRESEIIYDIPLTESQQLEIAKMCRAVGVQPSLVFAVMSVESDFNPDAFNESSGCCGIMQIAECNFDTYELTEPFNLMESARVGITMLSELLEKHDGNESRALIEYNCGATGARRLFEKGVYSTSYSRAVISEKGDIAKTGIYRIFISK
jgi:hypothetical protein